jgi:hypothetical protein
MTPDRPKPATAPADPDERIIDRIRRGRLAALAVLPARRPAGDREDQSARPTFHTCRQPEPGQWPVLILTNPVAA